MTDHVSDDAVRRRTQCQIRADIQSGLQLAITSSDFRRVQCACTDGTAILWGTVGDEESKTLAEHIAAHVENVENVVNRIQVEPSSYDPNSSGTMRMPHREAQTLDVRLTLVTS